MEKQKPITVEAKLIEKRQLTHDVIELVFESNPTFSFAPGQFISIFVPGAGPGGRDLRRAYSISSAPELNYHGGWVFELCVKLVDGGPGTTYLNNMKIGDILKGMTPYGDFVFKTHHAKHVLMVSTGTGIAPFKSMVFSKVYQDAKPVSTTLLFGARVEEDLIYTQELMDELGPDRFIQTLSRTDHTWPGFKGRVTDWIRQNAASINWKETEFYLCGNGAMIDEIKKILTENGVEKPCIHQEVYYKPKPGETHASQ